MCSHVKSMDDSSDEDIWKYKSTKRKKETAKITSFQEFSSTESPIIARPYGAISTSKKSSKLSKEKVPELTNEGASTSQKRHTTRKPAPVVNRKRKSVESGEIAQTDILVDKCARNSGNSSSEFEMVQNKTMTPVAHGDQCRPKSDVKKSSGSKRNVEGHCPMCQMPFCALTVDSPRTHVTECMDLPLINSQECAQGVECDCTIPSHYRKFKHSQLATLRSGITSHQQASARRSLSKSFQGKTNPQTPSFTNGQLKGAHSPEHAEVHASVMDQGESFSSDSDIFNLDTTQDEDADEQSTDSLVHVRCSSVESEQVGTESIDELVDVAELIADAISDEDESVSTQVVPDSQSSDSVICTGGSSSKENSFNLTPLKPVLTPVSSAAGDTLSRSEFLNMLIPQASQNTPSQKLPSSQKKTPRDRKPGSAKKAGLKKSTKSAEKKKAKSFTATKDMTRSVSTSDPSKKQRTVLSFFQPLEKKGKPKPQVKSATGDSEISSTSTVTSNSDSEPKVSLKTNTTMRVGSRGCLSDQQPASAKRPWHLSHEGTSNPLRVLTSNKSSKPVGNKASSDDADSDKQPTQSTSGWAGRGSKPCPFYKKIPGTPFTVDAFQYGTIPGCKAYFLSHFHYDHYNGLKKSFQHPIYSSRITANLVEKRLRVGSEYLRPLTMNEAHVIEGVEVTLLEANHCPGSVLILFKLPDNRVFLHTGDFRASSAMEDYPQLQGVHVHQLYLDTTYCDPIYAFPAQREVVQLAVDLATKFVYENPNGIVVVGSYTIGKERIFQAVAEELGSKICVARDKLNILRCLEDKSLGRRLTMKAEEARVHVLPMKSLNYQELDSYVEKFRSHYDKVLAFEPTGWTHSKKTISLEHIRPKIQRDRVTLYGIPYSEHSSYTEMKRFVQFLRPDKILPTVNNGSRQSRRKMESYFTDWMKEDLTKKPLKQAALNSWVQTPTK